MMELELQFFGGRGAGGDSDGPGLPSGGGQKNINTGEETNVWTYRHNPNNEEYVDNINESVRTIYNDFPGVMDETVSSVNATEIKGRQKNSVLGFYSEGDKSVNLNTNFTEVQKMNEVYDDSVASGFHPGGGKKSGVEAVTFHEMGHAVNDNIAQKRGKSLDKAADDIVNNAYKKSGGKGGTLKWAGTISKYAQTSSAECIAEAVADYYCNGKNASSASKAIVKEMKAQSK